MNVQYARKPLLGHPAAAKVGRLRTIGEEDAAWCVCQIAFLSDIFALPCPLTFLLA
jgi:hypothetical protein